MLVSGTDNGVAVWNDPERDRLLAELAVVNEELAAARLELADLELRLGAFATFHDRLLAPLYAELDDLNAQIAELLAERSGSEHDLRDAARARELADLSARAAEQAAAAGNANGERRPEERPPKPQPTDEARQLFRALIKRCHPDLASDEDDRERRERFTRLVNDAYAGSDTVRLHELDQQWRDQLDGATGRGTGRSAAELSASIGTARAELGDVEAEIAALAGTTLGDLFLGREDPVGTVEAAARCIEREIGRQREILQGLASR
jgi:hypothetical protein